MKPQYLFVCSKNCKTWMTKARTHVKEAAMKILTELKQDIEDTRKRHEDKFHLCKIECKSRKRIDYLYRNNVAFFYCEQMIPRVYECCMKNCPYLM